MKRYIIPICLLVSLTFPLLVQAVEKVDFEVKTTKNLLNLCTASPEDNFYAEAVNFCHGYLVGAYHYHNASRSGPNAKQEICVPQPAPSRNDTINNFIAWAKAHPQHHNELPVETEFRFLMTTWPCK